MLFFNVPFSYSNKKLGKLRKTKIYQIKETKKYIQMIP